MVMLGSIRVGFVLKSCQFHVVYLFSQRIRYVLLPNISGGIWSFSNIPFHKLSTVVAYSKVIVRYYH